MPDRRLSLREIASIGLAADAVKTLGGVGEKAGVELLMKGADSPDRLFQTEENCRQLRRLTLENAKRLLRSYGIGFFDRH